jgi:hypothetical protein
MSQTIERRFATRAEADSAVELLVQEHGVDRSDIFIAADGPENSVGEVVSGGDAPAMQEEEARGDAPLNSPVLVSVDINDDAKVTVIEAVLTQRSGY